MEETGYYDSSMAKEVELSPRTMPLKARLTEELRYARKNVERLEELVKLLDENPQTQRILELLKGH